MTTRSTTEADIKAILEALQKVHVKPYCWESGDPKYNAQRNLSGRTHYVDDDTLKFHKSRVLESCSLWNGLLFRIVCSDALDMHNTRRGFRVVVFDVFGTTIYCPKLEEAMSSKQAAINACNREIIDLVEHYRKALANELHWKEQAATEYRQALTCLPPSPAPMQQAA